MMTSKKVLIGLSLLCLLLLLGFTTLYFYNFYNYEISDKPSDWALAGDYFGGVLNPIISIFSLILLGYITFLVGENSISKNKELTMQLKRMDAYNSLANESFLIDKQLMDIRLLVKVSVEIMSLQHDTEMESLEDYHYLYNMLNDFYTSEKENLKVQTTEFRRFLDKIISFEISYGHLFKYDFSNPRHKEMLDGFKGYKEMVEEIFVIMMSLGASFGMDRKKYDRILEIIDKNSFHGVKANESYSLFLSELSSELKD